MKKRRTTKSKRIDPKKLVIDKKALRHYVAGMISFTRSKLKKDCSVLDPQQGYLAVFPGFSESGIRSVSTVFIGSDRRIISYYETLLRHFLTHFRFEMFSDGSSGMKHKHE